MKALESDLSPRLFDYLQVDKIGQLYALTVDRIEKSLVKKSGDETIRTGKVDGGLGELITQLGIKFSLAGDAQSRKDKQEETVYELSNEQKLRIVWKYMYINDLLADLNFCIKEREEVTAQIVRFEGQECVFSLVDPNSDPNHEHTLIRAACKIEDYATEFYCSRKYFYESSIMFDIQERISRNIVGIGTVKSIIHNERIIFLNPIAF